MKKLIAISLFIFWAVVVAIMVSGLVFYQNNKSGGLNLGQGRINDSLSLNQSADAANRLTDQSPGSDTPPVSVLSAQVVATHSSGADCWMIINNKVYNVTSYLNIHPGGAGAMLPYCGQDATDAFDTKGGSGHSSSAQSLLAKYYVGDLNQQTTAQQVQQIIQSSPVAETTVQNNGEGEEEDNDY